MFSCESYEIFKDNFSYRTATVAAYVAISLYMYKRKIYKELEINQIKTLIHINNQIDITVIAPPPIMGIGIHENGKLLSRKYIDARFISLF